MLSLQQAYEIKESVLAYLKATFNFQDKKVYKAFFDFINHPTEGLFKGPYISLKLPFVKANKDEIEAIPLTIKPDWPPYDHQVKSWHRLSTQNENQPQPTIITTGTGSGKTESFLYPILDYCYLNRSKPGIKTIILYPMNALATDQAKRLAEIIWEDERLKGEISAGLFIGLGKDAAKYPKIMGAENVIENRDSILDSPPDILLTNFKMLDYALLRNNFHKLWSHNLQNTDLLRFLVLDELHTYDGAQGTDVANLIRRLKLKLDIPENQLCPVGTSATIGSGEESPKLLSEYASKVYGENVTTESIITENRMSADGVFGKDSSLENYLPRAQKLKQTEIRPNENFKDYLKRQIDIWQLDENNLVDDLKKLQIVKDLVISCNENEGIKTVNELEYLLTGRNESYRKDIPQWDAELKFNPKHAIIQSLLALISIAKWNDAKKSPFLYVQVQFWIREASGILRRFDDVPSFTWNDHPVSTDDAKAMPPWFCRECGASGWLAVKHDNKERFEQDIKDVYTKFFSNHKHIFFTNLADKFSPEELKESGYDPTDVFKKFVYNRNLELSTKPDDGRVEIVGTRKLDNRGNNDHVCPECNTRNNLAIIGTRAATLCSIAVSQSLASDMDLQPEKNRKVLAFTNSVQDAAHQAGFIEARNFRFTFRSSLQRVINLQEGPVSLQKLSEHFIEFWKQNASDSGKDALDAYYYRYFPGDYKGGSSPADYKSKNSYVSHFQEEFDLRVIWEIYAEFGFNSLIGRTLEKTGSSAVWFDEEAINTTWIQFKPWLLANGLEKIGQNEFITFVNLVLHRIRSRGAISHPILEKFRTIDLQLRDLNWMKDSRHFLHRKFHPRSRIPKLITTKDDTRGLLDTTHSRTTNWFRAYYIRTFQGAPNYIDLVNEFYAELIEILAENEILDKKIANETGNYALNPAKILVSGVVQTLECTKCGHQLFIGGNESSVHGGKCLNYRCTGSYLVTQKGTSLNYYQLVYNRSRSPRIYAADHTGLLERKEREILEYDFKNRPHFNSKNAMVATSTLEMGIDIGTLNVALNNSVPPLPSNFLQRVGRAGRSSGSALIVNFAKSEAHDLFYFQEPLDMMAGEINTPGCYLEASEILKRHFFAFCIDSWTSQNPNENEIPFFIRFLRLTNTNLQSPEFFLNKILSFIKSNEQNLLSRFKNQYKGIADEVFINLENMLLNETFYQAQRNIFKLIKNELDSIQEQRNEIIQRIKDLNLGKEDPERLELEAERKNLGGIISSIKKRGTLEHLTNVGSLPNYAFPEKGITLSAKVLGNKAPEGVKPPTNKDFEIVRAASQAIKEFAPDNYFYSQGYRFQVTGINTFDWADPNNFQTKRFCSRCDHLDEATSAPATNCPKCGDESWSAASNVHYFARLLSVKSYNNQKDATLTDSKDEREKIFYHTYKHFDFKNALSMGAWSIKQVPFGIEFVKKVNITFTNLGRSDIVSARKTIINQKEVTARGFVTCKYCGKSTSHTNQRNYKYHFGYCKHKNIEYDEAPNEVFEELFFFREFNTEALKILLPVQEFNTDAEINMFRAGIELGLKKYYKGNPQHLAFSQYKEYNHRTAKFDRYLVLYDTIPGGTGYLEKLFNWEVFNKLLYSAFTAIKHCSCKHTGKDGCYRCIYTYGNQYYRDELSRNVAENRFELIIRKAEGWEYQANGLSGITNSGQIEESELERRFVRSLKNWAKINPFWELLDVNETGTVSYSIVYKNENTLISYHLNPQVDLGPAQGIELHSRTDFLLTCTHAEVNGNKLNHEQLIGIPKIAIYLDGYQYHASDENNNFVNDLKKRESISNHPEYLTWTITWNDLEQFDQVFLEENQQNERGDYLFERFKEPGFMETKQSLLQVIQSIPQKLYDSKNNMERLLLFMESDYSSLELKTSMAFFLGLYQKQLFIPSYAPESTEEFFNEPLLADQYCLQNRTLDGFVPFQGLNANPLFDAESIVNIKSAQVKSKIQLTDCDSVEKENWNQFWIYFNIIQFFDFKIRYNTELPEESIGDENKWMEELLESYDKEYVPLITRLFDKGYLKPTLESEQALNSLTDLNGEVIADATLIIQNNKIAIEPHSDNDKLVLIKQGYTIYSIDEIKDIEL